MTVFTRRTFFRLVTFASMVAFIVIAYTSCKYVVYQPHLHDKTKAGDEGRLVRNGQDSDALQYTGTYRTKSNLNDLQQPTNSDSLYFPCLADVTTSSVFNNHNGCVRTVNMSLASELIHEDNCVTFRAPGTRTTMCIHDPRRDRYISASVLKYGVWEEDLLIKMVTVLENNPGMDLLDIGCNIGAYTLTAATSGARVVAVDANKENLILLSKSVILGQLQDHVTLVWNALSNKYDKMFMDEWKFNIGGNKVKTYDEKQTPSQGSILTESVRLDDLQELFINRTVFIKIDVEEHEVEVFDGGAEFFRTVNVRFIQIEYGHHRDKPSGKLIVERLRKPGFTPFADCFGKKPLSVLQIENWPWDICFVKS